MKYLEILGYAIGAVVIAFKDYYYISVPVVAAIVGGLLWLM